MELCAMRRFLLFCLLTGLPLAAQVAPIPVATDLPGSPFFIKKNWYIGGTGNWDYLTLDPDAQLLYIAHGQNVQVVDITSGSVVATIPGFRNAHTVALDDAGVYGYVSDGPAGDVVVFERQNFKVQSVIPIYCSPRSLAFEPRSKLVFAICGAASAASPPPVTGPRGSRAKANQQPANLSGTSHVIAIDSASKSVVADIDLAGDFRFAVPDGGGQVYVSVGPATQQYVVDQRTIRNSFPPRVARLDGPAIAAAAQNYTERRRAGSTASQVLFVDDSHEAHPASLVHFLRLPAACQNPQGLAVDSKSWRLFAACDSQQFLVLNSNTGATVAAMVTGPGDDVIAYDQERGLIYVANGDGYGSLTIIRQDATIDSYEVIQNLPTLERARTLAVDSSSGDVYLVTDFHGADLTHQGGIGDLRIVPVAGSFQVLVVGH
jgi:DNA-binding beta-propeller fold protein YncE